MDSGHRLTVASIWRLEAEGIDQVTKFFKGLPHSSDGFCKYESEHDVFSIDNCSVSLSASAVAEYLASFIEEEKEHDLLECPKITRLSVLAGPEVEGEACCEEEDQLIEQLPPPEALKLPVVVKYWQEDEAAIEYFIKASRSILTAISQATGAQVDIEASNKRIRITSMEQWQADNAMERLSNVHSYLSLMVAPQVANILHVGGLTEFRLRVVPYRTLNDAAIRRVLVDGPESKLVNHLHTMFITVMEVIDADSRELKVPKNIAFPPRLTEQRRGQASIWDNFTFKQLGDASVLANLPPAPKEDPATTLSMKPDSEQDDELIVDHPWLSHEKASFVNKWVTEGVKAGAVGTNVSEPNSTLPPEPSAEVVEAPKLPSGLKRRQPLPPANVQTAPKIPQPIVEKPLQESIVKQPITEQHVVEKIDPEPAETPIELRSPKATFQQPVIPPPRSVLPESFNTSAYGHPKKSPPRRPGNVAPFMYPRPREYGKSTGRRVQTLIDTSTDDTEFVAPSTQSMSFSQMLVPSIPALQPRLASPVTSPEIIGTFHSPEQPTEENRDPVNDLMSNEERLRKLKRSTKVSSSAFERLGPKIIDGEETTRVFHRTMGQKSPVPPASVKRETKAEQKARKQAAYLEAWGPIPTPSQPKPAQAPEPSQWKKEKSIKEETIDTNNIKDLFGCLKPVLDAIQYFTGTLSVEIQLGLILTNSVSKLHTGRTLDLKAWNALFRPRHGLPGLTTVFNQFLTTSGTDIDYFFKLGVEDESDTQPYFEEEPTTSQVCYEFHCQTKDSTDIVIVIDESGAVTINRPEFVLGAANIHFPLNIWDLRVTVKGTQEYIAAPESGIADTVKCIVDNLYVPPDRTRVILFTRVPEDSALRITKILMKRTTRHKYVGKYVLENSEPSGSDCEQPLFLQITEVQRLISGNNPMDKNAIRVRSIGSEAMVEGSRLWFEASIVSPAIEKVLQANKNLTVGERVDSWRSDDLLGAESHFGGNITETDRPDEFLTTAGRTIGSSGIGNLFRVAKKVVEKIDVVGWANYTPTNFIQDKYPSPLASAGAGPFAFSLARGSREYDDDASRSITPTLDDLGPYW
ncbi:hypothetical protein H112_06676 [Trichophyton rubrum D6]|uniref:Uncharacterized protein n=3 Tax=Trichophyton rubrum TaxID=5551 RepID=A0A178F1K9_TRIRU|nr:uncharacterized protein TERG_02026 [Trichophyton rubrum CBS 118892]EZF12358.1 hypothetical protein H100_06692 [Trichophyton rubrum MR850]EZF39327.1 hypothetical protein H102_06659 [Trichophyton rubrum CBS 100081]EZF49781.1 hypothetical protein H103_06683 [Trichophyton rubrum CBS 288.86]EZF81802.1 hypothetical protein H110_06680 [Trichophyton rubrum MR1448]EZF92449.1 hypothetical protein H113_06729 [Trichophyton rubrum MR1459]EZG13933.1 hypothetical protein H107_06832 [Trichophyton rubrum C